MPQAVNILTRYLFREVCEESFAQVGERWIGEGRVTSLPWLPRNLAFELPGEGLGDRRRRESLQNASEGKSQAFTEGGASSPDW